MDMSAMVQMECSIQQGEAKFNRTVHLSPIENIYFIAQTKNIHYLYHMQLSIPLFWPFGKSTYT